MVLFTGNAAQFYHLHFVDRLAAIAHDYRLRVTMPQTVDERIVILDIDEQSLKEEGRWPWSRDRLASLMDQLFDHYGVAVAGFDVVFAEPDNSSGLRVLQQLGQHQLKADAAFQAALGQIQAQLEYDQLFADKIKNRKVVMGYYFTQQQTGDTSGMLPQPVFPAGAFKGVDAGFLVENGYGANLPELQTAARNAGHFNPRVDEDGVIRRIPMVVEYHGAYYASLSLAMVQTLFAQSRLIPGFAGGTNNEYEKLEWLGLDTGSRMLKIPVDGEASTLIPYRGAQGSFAYLSLADVLHGRVDAVKLKDKIVLIGTTAPGLMDLRSTPVGEVYPGVEVHANMIAGILDQNLKQRPAYMLGAEVLWLLVMGIFLSVLLPLLTPARAILVSAAVLTLTVLFGLGMWQYADVDMPVVNGMVMIALLFALNMSYGYFFESRTKRQITGLFGKYVPTELVAEMTRHPEQVVSMEGESREMTVLFSDVRGFTSIAEGLDAKELSRLMNEFLTPLSRVVAKHQGKVDKYMGDCIMAFWGAPQPLHDHARNALLAGLEMQSTLAGLQTYFAQRGWPIIKIGVGINTGRVSVGNMGSEVRVAYTVMGDEVNLASRLEGLTKYYGVGIIVGEQTRNAVTDFVYRELDHVRVKGKDKPVAIYEPMGLVGEVEQTVLDELKIFHEMRRWYRQKNWEQAELQLLNLQRMFPHTELYKIYVERIQSLRKNPPPHDWDGVTIFEYK